MEPKRKGRWTEDEHQRYLEGVKRFGRSWKDVTGYVRTRTKSQVKSHDQKFRGKQETKKLRYLEMKSVEVQVNLVDFEAERSETDSTSGVSIQSAESEYEYLAYFQN